MLEENTQNSILRGFWNGEPTRVEQVLVRVGKPMAPTWWCADLEGKTRKAVAVYYFKEGPFFLDDEDGTGWAKVTTGHGSPNQPHSSLPDSSVIVGRIQVDLDEVDRQLKELSGE